MAIIFTAIVTAIVTAICFSCVMFNGVKSQIEEAYKRGLEDGKKHDN